MSRGWLGLAGGGAMGFVAFLMILAPVSAAAPGMYTAPFQTGVAVQQSHVVVSGPGASVVVLTPATFSLLTGTVRERASAVVLGNMMPTLAAYTSTVGISGLAYTPSATGPHVLTVGWTLSFRASLDMVTKVATPNSGLIAHIGLRATTFLVEQSSGKVLPGSQVTNTILLHTITTGKFVENQGLTPYVLRDLPVTLTANHVYLITTVLSLDLVLVATPGAAPGSSASGSFALSSGASGVSYVLMQ